MVIKLILHAKDGNETDILTPKMVMKLISHTKDGNETDFSHQRW